MSHLLKENSAILVPIFMICSIPAFAFADEDKTSKKDIKDAEYYFYLGSAYLKLRMDKEAVDVFKQVIRIKPDHVDAHYNLGIAYGKLGKNQEAVDAYKQVIRLCSKMLNYTFGSKRY